MMLDRLTIQNRWIGITLAICATAAFFLRPILLEPIQVLLILLIIAIGLSPIVFYRMGWDRRFLPFAQILGLFHAIYFGASLFFMDIGWPGTPRWNFYFLPFPEFINTLSLVYTTTGLAALLGGFYLTTNLILRRAGAINFWPCAANPQTLKPIIFLSTLLYFLALAIGRFWHVSALVQITDLYRFVLFGAFHLLWLQKKLKRTEIILVFGLFWPLEMLLRLQDALLTPAFSLLLFVIFVHWRVRGLFPIRPLLILVILFFSIYESRSYFLWSFRYVSAPVITWFTGAPPPISDNGEPLDVKSAYEVRRLSDFMQRQGSNLARRVSYGLVFSHIVDVTPEPIDYLKGETYRNLFSNLVPRAFWPNKPTETIGGEFGRRYGFIYPNDFTTSMNLPWLIEAYINFGPWGMMGAMGAIGLFLGIVNILCNTNLNTETCSTFNAIVGGALIFRLMFPESNFTVMTGAFISVAVVLWISLWLSAWFMSFFISAK